MIIVIAIELLVVIFLLYKVANNQVIDRAVQNKNDAETQRLIKGLTRKRADH